MCGARNSSIFDGMPAPVRVWKPEPKPIPEFYSHEPTPFDEPEPDEIDYAEIAYWQFYCGVCDESPCISPNDCSNEKELYNIHMRQAV